MKGIGKTLLVLSVIGGVAFFYHVGCKKHGGEKAPGPKCDTTADCPSGYICQNGSCIEGETPPCATNADCPTGYICQNGACVKEEVVNPAPPTNLTANGKLDTIDLSWEASSSSNVVKYNIYKSTSSISNKDSSLILTYTTGLTYSVSGLQRGVRYYFRVTAVDNKGNESDFSNEVYAELCPDRDGDNYPINTCGGFDCDDGNPDINPGVNETRDGIDNNCNGTVDETPPTALNEWNDNPSEANDMTLNLNGSSLAQNFHDSTDKEDWVKFNGEGGNTYVIYTTELDQNVDTVIYLYNSSLNLIAQDDDSGGGYASKIIFPASATGTYYIKIVDKNGSFGSGTGYKIVIMLDNDLDGYAPQSVGGTDCADNDPNINPGASEICDDGIDNNCNGYTDSEDVIDNDQDGYGACGVPKDCNDNNSSINPGAQEICNNTDDNCNTQIDEGCDDDADGYGDKNITCVGSFRDGLGNVRSCSTYGNDCNDNNNSINPGVSEICDGIDNNCDSKIDYVNSMGDLDNSCGTDTFCLNYYCNEGVGCASAGQNEGLTCQPTTCGQWSACGDFSSICDESGTQTRTCTDYKCSGGSCQGFNRTEQQACYRDTDGWDCGTCKICVNGECSGTPADDSDCGIIDCDGLDTPCRNYHDLTSNRCEGFGDCKDPNSSDCTSYSNASAGTPCGNCSYNSCSGWTGSVYCTRTGSRPACDGNGYCSSSIPCSIACGGGTKCSGGSCVSATEYCNDNPNTSTIESYDDDCDGTNDEGLQDCYETGSCDNYLGIYSDCDNYITYPCQSKTQQCIANIFPSSDSYDIFYAYVNDSSCILHPEAWLSSMPAGVDYDLCIFFKCDSGPESSYSCDAGIPYTDNIPGCPNCHGCCSLNAGNTSEYVAIGTFDCPGINDSGYVYYKIYKFSNYSCGMYLLEVSF